MDSHGVVWMEKKSTNSWFPSIFRGQRDEKEAEKKQMEQPERQTDNQARDRVLGAKRRESSELETMTNCVQS